MDKRQGKDTKVEKKNKTKSQKRKPPQIHIYQNVNYQKKGKKIGLK